MKYIYLLLYLLLIPSILANPVIVFTDPTPANNTINNIRNISINTSVTGGTGNLTTLVNWNRSLYGWWRMNEAPGKTLVEDFSGYNNNGTWNGNVTSNITTGAFGNGSSLDGINDYINIPSINGFVNGGTLEAWVKSNPIAGITYQAEDTTGNSTGDRWTNNSVTYRRGRKGIDTTNGTLINFTIPNTAYGNEVVTITGYQNNTAVDSGNWSVVDETTGLILGSGVLSRVAWNAADKRMNNPFVFQANGHNMHVYVYFFNTTDVFIDTVSFTAGAYEGIICKTSRFCVSKQPPNYRVYINTASKIVAGTIDSTKWQYIVVTYDNINVKLYVNKVLVGIIAYTTPIADDTSNFTIGTYTPGYYYWGSIDEVRIWNRALSTNEINASYNTGLYQLQTNFTNLLNGVYNYTAYTQDSLGNVNSTEIRYLSIIDSYLESKLYKYVIWWE